MLEKIIEILKESKADAWEITDTKTRGWEFYFIRHELDQNRAKDVEHIRLTVHRSLDNGEALGSASDEINPTVRKLYLIKRQLISQRLQKTLLQQCVQFMKQKQKISTAMKFSLMK